MSTTTTRPTDSPSDDDLMQSINSGTMDGTQDALTRLQDRYGRQVRQFIRSIVKDNWLAQDVAQETFVKVFMKSHLYQIGTSFKAWVFEIARNQALSALRSKRRNPRPVTSLSFVEPDEATDVLDQVICDPNNRDLEEEEFMGAFNTAVEELPERYQAVFRRCVMQNHSYQEIADELGIPTGTVAIRIMRARKRLYQSLSKHLDRLRRPPACVQ